MNSDKDWSEFYRVARELLENIEDSVNRLQQKIDEMPTQQCGNEPSEGITE